MKIGVLRGGRLVLLQMAASCGDDRIELFDSVEVNVGERLVDEGPEVLGGLQFRAVGWLIDEPDAVWHGQIFRAVPTGIVELEDDDAIASGAGFARESFEQFYKERFVDPIR